MELKIKVFIFLASFLYVKSTATAAETNSTTEEPPISPCPCTDQAEGTVIPHPSDCRAYYTCLGGTDVRLNKCGHVDNFFHPYVRSCVQRSTFVSFVPDFIPTKDVCKISAVFPAPAMEDFGNCSVKFEDRTTSLDSDESLGNANVKVNPTSTTTATTLLPGLNKILSLFPWTMENQKAVAGTTSSPVNAPGSTTPTPSMMDLITGRTSSTLMQHFSTDRLMHFSNPQPISQSCKITEIIVHHFPGPCKTDITCEGGVKLTIDKCQNSLSLVSL